MLGAAGGQAGAQEVDEALEATHTDFRERLMVKLRGRTEQLVVSRNYVDQFKQM